MDTFIISPIYGGGSCKKVSFVVFPLWVMMIIVHSWMTMEHPVLKLISNLIKVYLYPQNMFFFSSHVWKRYNWVVHSINIQRKILLILIMSVPKILWNQRVWKKTKSLLLFLEIWSGLRNHQQIKEPEDSNFFVVFLIKVILLELQNVLVHYLFNVNAGGLVQWTTDMYLFHISKNIWGTDTL